MKSDEKSLTNLVRAFYKDMCAQCAVEDTDVVRDITTVMSRVEHEGLSFLTITLPTFGADFELALKAGQIDSTHFRSFKKCGSIPAFMQGMTSRVFDRCTGKILYDVDILAVKLIRQLSYMFKKIGLSCSPERERAALYTFVQDESIFEKPLHPEDVDSFKAVSDVLWVNVIGQTIDLFALNPKHGPGAVAERLPSNRKYVMSKWNERIEPYFSYYPFGSGTLCPDKEGEGSEVTFVSEEEELPVRVVSVPKTLKKPRIIAIEPACNMYVQQAIKEWLYQTLERASLTAGHINFSDQTVNQALAKESSASGQYATLDMSAASDRVPHGLSLSMFDCNPDLQGAIEACRSRTAQVSIAEEPIQLKKFASMGSALCFPVESMYFYTICIVALLRWHNLPVTYSNIQRMKEDVYVYGDDILVPTDAAATVACTLQKYYGKVNAQKSFWTGKFRESCGMDAYDGIDVTPVYIRSMPPCNRRNPSRTISCVETSNLLHEAGYWHLADYLKKVVEGIYGRLPIKGPDTGGLGWTSFNGTPDITEQPCATRYNKRYQVDEVKTWVPGPCYNATDSLDGWPALLKCLLKLEHPLPEGAPCDTQHLERSARHGAVALKSRWTSPLMRGERDV